MAIVKSSFYVAVVAFMMSMFSTVSAQAQTEDPCFFAPSIENAPIYNAPLTHPTQQKGTLEVGRVYPVLVKNGMHFYLILGEDDGGWVDRRSGTTSGNCETLSEDPAPITDFPTICTMYTLREIGLFDDPQLTISRGSLPQYTVLPIVGQNADSYYVMIDDAYGGWISSDEADIEIVGVCDFVAYDPGTIFATVTANTRVWSVPGVDQGVVVSDLPEGMAVIVIAPPVEGRIRNDTLDVGYWYYVALDSYNAPLGWIWEGRLNFASTPVANPTGDLLTLPDARLWSQPDVYSGEVTATLPANTAVTVLEGPVQGVIRYDTGASGTWYRVRTAGGETGWIWSGRLAF